MEQVLPTMLSTADVLRYLGVSRPTLHRLREAGELPATKVGAQWRYARGEVLAYLTAGRTVPRDDATVPWWAIDEELVASP